MASSNVEFYAHPQATALSVFLPLLKEHLPISNPLYVRLQAPHNTPTRHCQFAATFPPEPVNNPLEAPEVYTIIFADRSRHNESQIWLFNSLTMSMLSRPSKLLGRKPPNFPLSPNRIIHYPLQCFWKACINLDVDPSPPALSVDEQHILRSHVEGAIYFLKNSIVPTAPGWPFSPILRFSSLHEYITQAIIDLTAGKDALTRTSSWDLWHISTAEVSSKTKARRPIPEGFTIGSVPEEQLDIVLSTSSIPRQASTMLMLPNVGLLNAQGTLVAWGYIGIDGSFATLYVLPEQRGKGLASCVAVELLQRLHRGEFTDMGYTGATGWVHSHVHAGNEESARVMRSLGGKVSHIDSYTWVDSSKF